MQDQNLDKVKYNIEKEWKFWKKQRYIVSLLTFFGYCSSYIMHVNLSVAIVAMTSSKKKKADFDWDSKLQGYILSSFFYGYISSQLLGGWLSARVGGKKIFGIGIAIPAIATFFTPLAVKFNVYLFIILRVIVGICEGLTIPCNHAIWSNWAPPLERSKLSSIAISGTFTGAVFAMSTSGVLAENFGWDSIFYVDGIIALISFFLWWYFVTDNPEDDPRISPSELQYIKESIGQSAPKKILYPWKSICTSPPVLAITIAHFSENWGFYTILTQMPIFLNDMLNFQLENAGFFSALPYLGTAIVMPISGYIADYVLLNKTLRTGQVRKIFSCTAFINQALCIIACAFTGTTGTIICLTLTIALGGFACSGFFVNHLDIAPRHASVLLGISSTIASLPGILSPIISGYITQNRTVSEWRIVFIIAACIYLSGAIIYGIFASGEEEKWAKEPETKDLKIYTNKVLDVNSDM